MKKKILTTTALMMALALVGSGYAAGQDISGSVKVQVQQSPGLNNQMEVVDVKVKTQNGAQPQDETLIGVQNQEQIKVENKGEEKQIKTENKEQEKKQTQEELNVVVATQRRSNVATAVQEMLHVADRNGGIGEQVREIAQKQTQNQEKLEVSLQKIQNRNKFVRFFIGQNYGEINNAEKTLEQNREQIKVLNEIKVQLTNEGDEQLLTEQIQTLEEANLEIENSLEVSQEGFSLFGWMFKRLAK
jgi:DsbC/DsbD-like thiol-disulfide interchange protein